MTTIQDSMMNCFRLILCAAVALFAVGCSADVDSELGYDIIPDHQKMEMRHLTFKGGKVLRFNAAASDDDKSVYDSEEGNFFRTSLYRTDSLLSSNISYGYIGVEHSDTFGMRSSALASSILFMNSVDKETGFGYRPIFDTLSLILTINDYGVDTLTPVRYEIYELTKPLLGSVVDAKIGLLAGNIVSGATLSDITISGQLEIGKSVNAYTFKGDWGLLCGYGTFEGIDISNIKCVAAEGNTNVNIEVDNGIITLTFIS